MTQAKPPAVVALDMGYGHLRAAMPLAEAFDVPLMHADRAPLADERDRNYWRRVRQGYELISRASQLGRMGAPLAALLDDITNIPALYPPRDLSAPHAAVRLLETMASRGVGEQLAAWLRDEQRPLVTTFYAPAMMADRLGLRDIWCVVTDSDLNRIWVSGAPSRSSVNYFAPAPRVVDRLRSYGVPERRIHFTGFPLPDELVGEERDKLEHNLKSRLVRLDPKGVFRASHRRPIDAQLGDLPIDAEGAPPHVAFAIGGAGAQTELAGEVLRALAAPLRQGKLRLTLVAGVRQQVADKFARWIAQAGLDEAGVEVLVAPDFAAYYAKFNTMLAQCDVLWTKPSEMTFYTALGLPLVFAPPVGVHEHYNRRWASELGGGLLQREPAHAAFWLTEWLDQGTLAAAAWSGYMRFPQRGSYAIRDLVTG